MILTATRIILPINLLLLRLILLLRLMMMMNSVSRIKVWLLVGHSIVCHVRLRRCIIVVDIGVTGRSTMLRELRIGRGQANCGVEGSGLKLVSGDEKLKLCCCCSGEESALRSELRFISSPALP